MDGRAFVLRRGLTLAGVRVSDGVSVARIDCDGRYTLIADTAQS